MIGRLEQSSAFGTKKRGAALDRPFFGAIAHAV